MIRVEAKKMIFDTRGFNFLRNFDAVVLDSFCCFRCDSVILPIFAIADCYANIVYGRGDALLSQSRSSAMRAGCGHFLKAYT